MKEMDIFSNETITKPFDFDGDKFGLYCYTRVGQKVALMCPKCFKVVKCETKGYITAKAEGDVPYLDLLVKPSYQFDCMDCHNVVQAIPLDYQIGDVVSNLNSKGYQTQMSCAGHLGEINPSVWIKFVKNYSLDRLPSTKWIYSDLFLKAEFKSLEEQLSLLEELEQWSLQLVRDDGLG